MSFLFLSLPCPVLLHVQARVCKLYEWHAFYVSIATYVVHLVTYLCYCVMVAAAVSFIIKTKEEEAPVLKKSAALQYETSDEDDDDDDDDADGKDTVEFVALVSVVDVGYV